MNSKKQRVIKADGTTMILDLTCSLERRCKTSENKFWDCINRLKKIGQEKLAKKLFNKFAPIWI